MPDTDDVFGALGNPVSRRILEWGREMESVGHGLAALELRNRLRGPDDHRHAILTIHLGAAGAG